MLRKRNQRQAYRHRDALDAAMALLSDYAEEPEILCNGAVRVALLESSRVPLATLKLLVCKGAALGPGYVDLYFDERNRDFAEHLDDSEKRRAARKLGHVNTVTAPPSFVPQNLRATLALAQKSLGVHLECGDEARVPVTVDSDGGVRVSMAVPRALREELEAVESDLKMFKAGVCWSVGAEGAVVSVDLGS